MSDSLYTVIKLRWTAAYKRTMLLDLLNTYEFKTNCETSDDAHNLFLWIMIPVISEEELTMFQLKYPQFVAAYTFTSDLKYLGHYERLVQIIGEIDVSQGMAWGQVVR